MNRSTLQLPGDTDRVEQLQYVTLDDGPVGSSFIGDGSGGKATSITNSIDNTFVGFKSGGVMTAGTDNVLIGTDAGANAENLYDVVGVGKSAVKDALDCMKIVAIGTDAGKHLQASYEYVTVGHSSGTGTKATNSVAVGTYAGHLANNIDGVCFVGHKAGQNTSSSFRTVAVGSGSLEKSGDITDSVVIGSRSGLKIQSIANVVAIGSGVMANVSCQGTEFNTVVGAQAAYEMCGDQNTVMGYAAASNVHGDEMTIIGASTAQDIDGNASVIVGANLCNEPQVVTNCTIIGHDIKPNVDPSDYDTVEYNNSVFIGNNLKIETDEFENSLVIGVGDKRFLQARGESAVLGDFTGTFSNVIITGDDTKGMQVETNAIFRKDLLVQTTAGDVNIKRLLEDEIISQKQIFVKTNGIDNSTGRSFEDAFGSINYACSRANPGDIIVVEAGTYEEDTPIIIPPDVSIVGQDLRSTIIDPIDKRKHVFYAQQGVYITGLRVINLRRPACTICFPCSQVDSEIGPNGELTEILPLHSLSGYTSEPEIFVEAPSTPGGVQATVSCSLDENGSIASYTIDDPGSGYTRRPHISIPPPQKVFLTKSPYIQNVTMITQGLYTKSGQLLRNDVELRQNYTYPLDLDAMNIDQEGGGGGCLVDGNCVQDDSPIRSILAATFTVLSHGGIGHHCTNQGFAQLVSTYTHFASIGFLTTSGGELSISNSVSDFGLVGLVAEGYWPRSIATITVTSIDATDTGTVTSITGTYTGRKPDVGAAFYLQKWHYIRSSELSGQQVTVEIYPYFPDTEIQVSQGIDIYVPSKIYTASILFEFCGSGISYNALPTFSGTPDPEREINQVAPGICYYTSSDHLGNLKVGPQFYVNQLTGEVKLTGEVELQNIVSLGPFLRNQILQGVAIREFSERTDLTDSTDQSTHDSVSTTLAVKTYVDTRVTPGGETHNILHKVSDADWDMAWSDTLYANVSCSNANIDNVHANALEVDGNVVITEGNLILNEVVVADFSTDNTLIGSHDTISTTKAVKEYVDIRATPGGETHDILHKVSDADWDTAWSDTLYANVSCSNANIDSVHANALEVDGNVVIREGNLVLNEVVVAEFSTDNTLVGSHDTISTTKAVKEYIDQKALFIGSILLFTTRQEAIQYSYDDTVRLIQCDGLYYEYDVSFDWTNLNPCFTSVDGKKWKPYGDIFVEHFGAKNDGIDSFQNGRQTFSYKTNYHYYPGDIVQYRNYDFGILSSTIGLICTESHTSSSMYDEIDLSKFAVGEFKGTDNYASILDAITYAQNVSMNPTLHFQKGGYRIDKVHAKPSDIVFPLTLGKSLRLIGNDTQLFLEEDPLTIYNGLAGWFGHIEARVLINRIDLGIGSSGGDILLDNITFNGVWSHYPNNQDSNKQGCFVFYTIGLQSFTVIECSVKDWRGVGFFTINSNKTLVSKCNFHRCTADQVRHMNVNNVTVENCTFLSIDDDPISWTSSPNAVSPKATNINILHNSFIDTESLYIGHSKYVKVICNTLQRCKGGIYVGYNRTRDNRDINSYELQDTSALSIMIHENSISSAINRWDNVKNSNKLLSTHTVTSAYINVASPEPTQSPYPTEFDTATSSFIMPFDSHTTGPGYYYTDGSVLGGEAIVGPGTMVSIFKNHLIQDIRPVSSFSDLGYGEMFSYEGWIDPEISQNVFKQNGITVQGFVKDFMIGSNIIHNMTHTGIKLLFGDDQTTWFKQFSGIICQNRIINCQTGISHNKIESLNTTSVSALTIESNTIDADPYHIHPDRQLPLNGSWANASQSSSCIGINMRNVYGVTIRNNSISNTFLPIFGKNCVVKKNIIFCQPIDTDYNINNKGCGLLYRDNNADNIYVIVDSDPTSAAYKSVINVQYMQSESLPTSGVWIKGSVVRNLNYNPVSDNIWEWRRITTGSSHVLDQDWIAVPL